MAHNDSPLPFPDSDTDPEFPAASPTAHLLDELALYGYRPGQDEPDPRPLPEPDAVQAQLDRIGRSVQRHADRHPPRGRSR